MRNIFRGTKGFCWKQERSNESSPSATFIAMSGPQNPVPMILEGGILGWKGGTAIEIRIARREKGPVLILILFLILLFPGLVLEGLR